jgi:hypothetical protein
VPWGAIPQGRKPAERLNLMRIGLERRREFQGDPSVSCSSPEGETDIYVWALEEPVWTVKKLDKAILEFIVRWIEGRSKIVENRFPEMLD